MLDIEYDATIPGSHDTISTAFVAERTRNRHGLLHYIAHKTNSNHETRMASMRKHVHPPLLIRVSPGLHPSMVGVCGASNQSRQSPATETLKIVPHSQIMFCRYTTYCGPERRMYSMPSVPVIVAVPAQ